MVIFLSLASKAGWLTPGFNRIYVLTELLPQYSSSQPIFFIYDHGNKYSKSKDVLLGKSFKTPVTVKLSVLSSLTTLPSALSVPNSLLASFCVITISSTLLKAVLALPSINGKLKVVRKPGSVKYPSALRCLSPIVKRKPLWFIRTTSSTSAGYSSLMVGPNILGVELQ